MLKSSLTILGRVFIILLVSVVIFSIAYGFSLLNPSAGRFRPEGSNRIGLSGAQSDNSSKNQQPNGRGREEHEGFRGGISITRGFGQFFTYSLIIAIFVWVGLLIFPRFRRRIPSDN